MNGGLEMEKFNDFRFYAYQVFHRKSKFYDQIEVFWQIQSRLILRSPLHPTANFQVSNLCKTNIFLKIAQSLGRS